MGILFTDLEECIQRQQHLRAQMQECESQCHILEKDIDGYAQDGYTHLKNVVLPLELVRLAKARMRLGNGEEDHDEHMKILGQYNEVELLMRRPDEAKAELLLLTGQLRKLGTALQQVNREIETVRARKAS